MVLTDPSISRQHLELAWIDTSWVATDTSTHGSFDPIGVRLAPRWTVGANTTVRLGGVEGTEIRIELLTRRPETDDYEPVRLPQPSPPAPPSGPPGLAQDRSFNSASPVLERPGPIVDAPSAQGQPPRRAADPLSPAPAGHAHAAPGPFGQPSPPLPPLPPSAPFGQSPQNGPAPAPPPPSAFDQPPPAQPQPPAAPSPFSQPTPKLPAPPSPFNQPAPPDQPAPPGQPTQPNQQPPGAASPFAQQATPPPSPAPSLFDPPPGNGDNGHQFAPAQGQAVRPAAQTVASETLIGDDSIKLTVDGRDYVFMPGNDITIGRDPSCLVALTERHSLVSRNHLRIVHREGAWFLEDGSSKGTFIDGKRLSAPYRAEGAFIAQLGDDDAGTPLRVITAGSHRSPRPQNLVLLIAVGVIALIAVAALALVLKPGGDDQAGLGGRGDPASVDAASLASAKQSTVLLASESGLGSGFFITDNLIVTNQHVSVLAPSLNVAVSRTADDPAQFEFMAETVAVHPFLDIAVLRLTTDLAGNPVSSSGLPSVSVGDSSSITLGDEVYNTGFPETLSQISLDDMGELLLPPVSATSGGAASFSIWPGCSNPDSVNLIPLGSPDGVTCAPEGDVARAIIITTFSSGQGASGSPVFSGNEVVAVVFAGPADEANAGRNIATSAFLPWLTETIAANG